MELFILDCMVDFVYELINSELDIYFDQILFMIL